MMSLLTSKSKRHIDMSKIVPLTTPVISLFRQSSSDQEIEAEVRWATFVAKHDISFLSSDHVTRFF